MAQFDVHRNPNASQRHQPAFFIVLQSDFVDYLTTRLVAPLYDIRTVGNLPDKLAPTVIVEGREYVVAVPQMAGIPKARLGAKVASLDRHHDALVGAMDFLISGF
jgi:toxin CcdB